MIYDINNARGAKVWDVEARKEIPKILRLDTASGEVECHGQLLRFERIHPIYAGGLHPVLFHCYRRKS